jgi:adenylyltransferase/sulfurtransferase
MSRYNRHIILSEVGPQGQDKLLHAKVLVVGAGGLGCPVLQYLTAAGIGTLGIIDFDEVEESNLQRQILFGTSSLGKNKALAAKKRLEDLNPTIVIKAYPEKLTSKNAIDLFKPYNIIVDGTDNFATRYLINDVAILCDKPIVYGAIYKFEGQVSVFNYKNGPSYRCLFPFAPNEGSVANCSEVGVLGVLPGIIGTMMANEVIKMILEFDHVLSGKLLCYNSKTTEITTLKIKKNPRAFEDILKQKIDAIQKYEDNLCHTPIPEITTNAVLKMENTQFIDVRYPYEEPKFGLDACLQIPLDELENRIDEIDTSKTIIVFCQSGLRSKFAVEVLNKHHITNCFSLKGGIDTINEILK